MASQPPEPDGRPPSRSQRKGLRPMALAGAGLELGGVVALLTLAGWWLDGKLGTYPGLMLTGAAIGIIGGLYNLYLQAKKAF